MVDIAQERQQRQNLIKILESLSSIKVEDLARDDLGKEINFRSELAYFDRIVKLSGDLLQANLDAVPINRLNKLAANAQDIINRLSKIKNFSLLHNPQNPKQTRDQMIDQLLSAYENYYDQVAPIIALSSKNSEALSRMDNEAKNSLEKFNLLIAEQEKSRNLMMSEIEGTLEKIKRAAQDVGVAQHAIHFMKEAGEHKTAATKWLWATAILTVFTLSVAGISLYNLFEHLPALDFPRSFQLTVAKLIIFSVLFSGIIWMGRVYRAHRHNYVVNKHRQNALSTFETFVKAANDDQTKSAVLLQATTCIFSQQHTGYISQESDTTGSPQILEIIRGMSGSQSKTT